MGYLFLAVSLFAGVTKGFCGKKTSSYTTDTRSAVLVNVIRMLLCVVIGFAFVLFDGGIISLSVGGRILPYAALAGVSTAIFAVTWILSVRQGAYMLVDVSLMCGVFVPVLGSLIFLDEGGAWNDFTGLAMLVAAVVCMCFYNNRTKTKLTPLASLLLITCGACSGLMDFSQKLYVASGGDAVAAFSFYSYIFAFLSLGIYYLFTMLKKKGMSASSSHAEENKASSPVRVLPFIAVMALCMFAATYFQTLAAQSLPATTLYPLARGIALILSALMSWIFFREKLTIGSASGMGLAFAALLMINLL